MQEIIYELFQTNQSVSSAGINFTVPSGGLKQTIRIQNWNFSAPSNTLDLHFSLNITPPATNISSTSSSPGVTQFTFIANVSALATSQMQLLNKAVVDGKNINISFDVVLQSGGSVVDVVLHFPHFSSSLEYDPDFSIVFGGGDGTTGNGGDGGSTNLLPLLALLALIIPIAMVAVVVVVLVVLGVMRWRKWKQYGPSGGAVSL